MDLYTRRQLALLLVVVLVAGAGLGIDRWRRSHPGLAERLEALDRTVPVTPPPNAPWPPRPARPLVQRETRQARDSGRPTVKPSSDAPLDLNRADQLDLERLPGIGRGLAARILDSRASRGTFESVDDLRRVRGIGDATLARLRPLLAINPVP